MTPVLVTGGTGTLGRRLVPLLEAAGATARVLSRRDRRAGDLVAAQWVTGDLDTGAGLDEALDGAGAVVHCASDSKRWARDVPAVERLLAAVPAGCTPHLVYLSIVGDDVLPIPCYRVKLRVEGIVASSGLPWTVLRASQFHDLVAAGIGVLARLPVVPVPDGARLQPVDAGEVADRLTSLALGAPSAYVPELGGPHVRTVGGLARAYLAARGPRRRVVELPVPGFVLPSMRRGAHLTPEHADGSVTFEQFLARTG